MQNTFNILDDKTCAWPVLKKGSSRQMVYALQYLLNGIGYTLSYTGTFDNATEDAVKEFNKDLHIESTPYYVTGETWQALILGASASSQFQDMKKFLFEKRFYFNVASSGVKKDLAAYTSMLQNLFYTSDEKELLSALLLGCTSAPFLQDKEAPSGNTLGIVLAAGFALIGIVSLFFISVIVLLFYLRGKQARVVKQRRRDRDFVHLQQDNDI